MAEQRKFARIPLTKQIKVKFKGKEQFVSNFVSDISLGGMFLKTKTPLKRGTVFNFEFQVEQDIPSISGVGLVVRVNETDHGIEGMGIKFLSLDGDGEKLISVLVRNYLKDS